MPYAPEPDFVLLARYFAGEATPDQRAAVEAWASSDRAKAEELELLRGVWERGSAVPNSTRIEAMWSTLSRRMQGESAVDAPRRFEGRVSRPNIAPIAARRASVAPWLLAASLVAIASLGVWRISREETAAPIAGTTTSVDRHFATTRGERTTIRLSDGTRVELGYASTLRARSADAGPRELWLEGEASFDVVHDATRPFIVHAGDATTEDLGTSFAIRAYDKDSVVRVVVMSGKVALRPTTSRASGGTILLAGYLGTLRRDGRVDVQRGVDTTAFLGWLNGEIAFQGARIDEVAAELERRFDIRIQVSDPAVAAQRVNLQNFPARALGEVLDAVTVPYDLRYRRVSGTVILER